MYFSSRQEAGYRLALQLMQYRYENCVVVCLNEGSVLVGQQIASSLHCIMTLLLYEEIEVPGEGAYFGALNQSGRFSYNSRFSSGQIDAFYSEYHGFLEDKKREGMSRINKMLGEGGIVNEEMLKDQVVILVSDGLPDGAALDAAADFLRPVRVKRLVIVSPTASVEAVDRLHVLGDETHVLGVTDNYMGINHYYDDNDLPDREIIMQMLNDTVLNWY